MASPFRKMSSSSARCSPIRPRSTARDQDLGAAADGTPLVTASKLGQGWLVLFHVTANSDWSNLPISGLFVEMLRRTAELSNAATGGADGANGGGGTSADTIVNSQNRTTFLSPLQTLDGLAA